MRVTIKDIARETGLSITTVSLVLNNKANNISERTKKRVLETAQRMNYRPNQLAVSLVKKRTKTIGVIIPNIGNLFFAELVKGIDEEMRRENWNIILCNTDEQVSRDIEYLNMLYGKGVDGIIYAISRDYQSVFVSSKNTINSIPIPIVFVDRYDPMFHCSSVLMNDKMGSYLATRHLIELGHRRIGCIAGPENLANARERLAGYFGALKEAGIEVDRELIYFGNYRMDSGIDAVNHLLKEEITAIHACNDLMAYGAMERLHQLGIRVPQEMSLVGFDDIFFSDLLNPPLTSVRQPTHEIGQAAAKRLIEEMRNPQKQNHSHTVMEPELMIRSSTAPPRTERLTERLEEIP